MRVQDVVVEGLGRFGGLGRSSAASGCLDFLWKSGRTWVVNTTSAATTTPTSTTTTNTTTAATATTALAV